MARNYAQEAQEFESWLSNNKEKAGTPQYQQVELGLNSARRMAGLMAEVEAQKQDPSYNPAEYAGIAAEYLMGVAGDFAKAALIKGGPSAVGQVLGGLVGEKFAGKWGRKGGEVVGGGLGGAVGSVAYQTQRGDGIKLGELATDVLGGAMQTKSVLGSATIGTGLDIVRQAADEGRVDVGQALAAGAGAGAGTAIAGRVAGRATTPYDALMDERRAIFEDVRRYGVVVNPASLSTEFMPSSIVAGPAVAHKAAFHNQLAWQKMAFEQADIEMPKNGVFIETDYRLGRGKNAIPGTIDRKIEEVAAPYREIEAISKEVAEEIDLFKQGKPTKFIRPGVTVEGVEAMKNAKKNLDDIKSIRFERRGVARRAAMGDPEAKAQVKALIEQEKALDQQLEIAAVAAGDDKLVERLRDARQKISILNTIADATTTYGTVSPQAIWNLREAGIPTTGNLERMARFYDAFRRTGEATEVGDVGLAAHSGGVPITYATRAALEANPGGFAAAAVAPIREFAQEYLLAPGRQASVRARPTTQLPEGVAAALARQGGMLGGMNINQQTPVPESVRSFLGLAGQMQPSSMLIPPMLAPGARQQPRQ